MRLLFCLMGILALCACDRPKYDVQLVCGDGAKGDLLVDAKIYESHADLTIKRLTLELRETALGSGGAWLAGYTWLYNKIPQIDDIIEITLPVNEPGNYEISGKIKLEVGHGKLTGGLNVILWHMSDNLSFADGEKIPDGTPMVGSPCEVVVYPTDVSMKNVSAAQSKEIKNCMAYIGSQLVHDDDSRLRVYDENTGREMYIGEDAINEIFNGIELHHFYLENAHYYPEDALLACDVAARLREYIASHIDDEYIPEPQNVISLSAGSTMSMTCDGEEVVIRGE